MASWRDSVLWPAPRVWSVLAEHFVQPVEHDAVLEAEVVELTVEECAVVGCEDLALLGQISPDGLVGP
jgi:hypothetical protein